MDVALCSQCTADCRTTALMAGPGLYVEAAAAYAGHVRAAVLAMKRGERAFLDPLAALIAARVPDGSVLVPARQRTRLRSGAGTRISRGPAAGWCSGRRPAQARGSAARR
jgi:hypothetical protein